MNYGNRFICIYLNLQADINNKPIYQVFFEIFVDNDGLIYFIDEF